MCFCACFQRVTIVFIRFVYVPAIDGLAQLDEITGLDLLDTLNTVTEGTRLGTALQIMNAFKKLEQIVDNYHNVRKAVNTSLAEMNSSVNAFLDDLPDAPEQDTEEAEDAKKVEEDKNPEKEAGRGGTAAAVTLRTLRKARELLRYVNMAHDLDSHSGSDIATALGSLGQSLSPGSALERSFGPTRNEALLNTVKTLNASGNLEHLLKVIDFLGKMEVLLSHASVLSDAVDILGNLI